MVLVNIWIILQFNNACICLILLISPRNIDPKKRSEIISRFTKLVRTVRTECFYIMHYNITDVLYMWLIDIKLNKEIPDKMSPHFS